MNYLYKLVTTENDEINYDAFKKKELIECLATMRSIYFSLQQENQQLKEKLDCDLQWAFKYEKQVDNWNKLKKFLELRLHENCNLSMYGVVQIRQEIEKAIFKMQELERGVSDVED